MAPHIAAKNRAWQCIPPLAMLLCDVTITLLGQDDRYWQGDYSVAVEKNPIGLPLLVWHPLAFVFSSLAWGVLFAAIILVLKPRAAIVVSFLVTLGHALGTASWLPRYGLWGWFGVVAVLLLAQQLLTLSWKRAGVYDA